MAKVLYSEVYDLEQVMQTPFIDSDRLGMIRLALVRAYRSNDREAIKKAASAIQKYIDEGGDDYRELDFRLEDYNGTDPEKLADKYILRVMHDRHCDDDEDQDYIKNGYSNKRKEPVQLSLFD